MTGIEWQNWWHHSLIGKGWQGLQQIQASARVLSPIGLGVLIICLLISLPYFSTSQLGLLLLAIALFYFPLACSNPLAGPLFSYGVVATLATAFSPVRSAAMDGLGKLLLYGLLFLAMHRVFRANLRWRSWMVGSYLLTNILVVVVGLRQQFFGAQQLATWWDPASELSELTRVYSFLGNPNLMAGYLLPGIPLGIVAILLTDRKTWKLLLAMITTASALCILFSYSRGAWIGLSLEVLVLTLVLLYWRFLQLPVWGLPAALGGMVGAMAAGVWFKPSVRLRVASIFSVVGDGRNIDKSIDFRLKVIQACLEIVKQYPLWGIGPGNKAFNQVYPLFQKVRHSALGAYSVPLEITIETGFVGLIVYGWMLVAAFRWAGRSIVSHRQQPEVLWVIGGTSAVVGLIGHALADTVWYRPQVQVLWWLCLALMVSIPWQQARLDPD